MKGITERVIRMLQRYKNILVPIDGSYEAELASIVNNPKIISKLPQIVIIIFKLGSEVGSKSKNLRLRWVSK